MQNVADVSVLQKHLRKLVPLLLEDGGEAPAAPLEAALEEQERPGADAQVPLGSAGAHGPGGALHAQRCGLRSRRGAPPGTETRGDNGLAFVCSASRRWPGRVGWRRRLPGWIAGGGRIPASVT